MPYDSIADLPERVKEQFKSTEERRAFREAYNAAWEGKDGGRQGDRESCSFAVATEAAKGVKKAIAKQDDDESARSLVARLGSALNALLTGSGAEHGHARATVHHYDEGEDASFSFTVEIAKADDERQILYGVALEPDTEDAQGDLISADEIEKTAHGFLQQYGLQKAELGLEHQLTVNRKSAAVVESYIAQTDFDLGDKPVKKGSWVVGVHIPNEEIWKATKRGEFTGFSIGGRGRRIAA